MNFVFSLKAKNIAISWILLYHFVLDINYSVNQIAQMPAPQSTPIICKEVIVTYDLLSSDRVPGKMTIYNDKIQLHLQSDQTNACIFDLFDLHIQFFPNMDTLIVIGSGSNIALNIYVFLPSMSSRNNCLSTMRLLGFFVVDEHGKRVGANRIKTSNSLPCMSTIIESM